MIHKYENGKGETIYQNKQENPDLIAVFKHELGTYNDGYYSYIGQPYNQNYLPLGMRFFKYDHDVYHRGLLRLDYGGWFMKEYDPIKDLLIYAYQVENKPKKYKGFYWEYDHKNHTFKLYNANEDGSFTLVNSCDGLSLKIMDEVYNKTLLHARQDNLYPNFKEINYQDGAYYVGHTLSLETLTPDLFGLIFWNNQDYYVGEWVNGTRTGFGFYDWKNADSYSHYYGDFINNQLTGFGCLVYKNQDFYQGTSYKGIREGFGRYVWHDKDGNITVSYLGEWKNGKRHGNGKILFYSDNTLQVGRFENDQYIGK